MAPRAAWEAVPEAAWETQQHVARLLGPALTLPVLAGLVALALTLVPDGPARGWLRAGLLALALAAAAVLVVGPVARWASWRLLVTATHVALRDGLLRRRERTLPLARVAEVRTVQTALGRVLGHGTLLVLPERGPLLRCEHVSAVRAVQALVLERAQAAGAGRSAAGLEGDGLDPDGLDHGGGDGGYGSDPAR
jgi:membrane protein YdbS with pleckstrin-like domain